MALGTNPTFAEVKAAYAANVGYDLESSTAMAKEFIKACRLLLSPQFSVKSMSHGLSRGGGGEQVELDMAFVERQLQAALAWLQATDPDLCPSPGGGGVVHADLSGFRE